MIELNSVLSSINQKSSPGFDQIPYSFFVHSPEQVKVFFLEIINKSWTTGIIPKNWKTAIIKPILKSNKNKNDLNSYRPISLITTMSKIMKKMVVNRLSWFLEKIYLLDPPRRVSGVFFQQLIQS